jgi:hypothetical protein
VPLALSHFTNETTGGGRRGQTRVAAPLRETHAQVVCGSKVEYLEGKTTAVSL